MSTDQALLCAHRQYYATLQCLHDSLVQCSADETHLYVIATRIGHLRTSMQHTCRATTAAAVTSRRPDDVIGHVTSQSATRRADKDGRSWSSVDCGSKTTAAGAPLSQPLHGSAPSLSAPSVLLTSAGALAILRRNSPTFVN